MKLGMSSAQTRFFHVVLLICLSGLSGCYGEKPDELTDCLDHAIDNKVSSSGKKTERSKRQNGCFERIRSPQNMSTI